MAHVKLLEDAWGGLAWFNGVIARVRSPAALVSLLLPAPLRARAEPQTAQKAEHPLVFLFGELRDGGAHVGGRDFSLGIRYHEVAVMVPQVRHASHDSDTLFACEMFADDSRPILLGNAAYGFRKRQSRIECCGSNYEVLVGGQRRFAAQGALAGAWRSGCPGHGDARWLEDLAASPVLGRRANGDYVLSRFSWDLSDASLCAVSVELQWSPEPGAPLLHLRSEPNDALVVRDLRWRTSPPTTLT
jgi:hypothetical protein